MIYVLTSPQDVTQVYRNTKSLTFYEYVQDVMRSLSVSEGGIEKLWQSSTARNASEHAKKCLAEAGEDFYREQFLPGQQLDVLWHRVISLLNVHVTWERLVKGRTTRVLPDISLLGWTQDVLLQVVIEAFFGKQLLRIEPQMIKFFVAFDDQSWKLTYKYPRRASRDMHKAKDSMVAAIEQYLRLPKDQRSDQAWLISKLEFETKDAGIDTHDLAAMITSLLWVYVKGSYILACSRVHAPLICLTLISGTYRILSNAYKLCFWTMAHLLFKPDLFSIVKAEIDQAASQGLPGLELRLDDCPRLVSVYWEVIRLTSSSTSIRTVEAPTILGRYLIPSKAKLLLPFRQLHFNQDVFGANVNTFDAERFQNDPTLSKSPSFRPFGGGSTYCPGRHVARREVLVFIAMAISRFDLELDPEHVANFPVLDTKKPSLGMMMPVAGQDVRIRISRRNPKANFL